MKKIKIQITHWITGQVLFGYESKDNTLEKTLREAFNADANLRGANLTGANLTGANLRGANLTGANLWGANLRDANLTGANLRDANLRDASLWGANLWGANLRGANLTGANLRDASLWDANLTGANLTGADGLDIWWHVHHEILYEQLTEPIRNRILYIKNEKAKNETTKQIKLRLKLLKPVLGEFPKTKKGWEALHKKECPKCPWNGKSIFSKKDGA